MKGAAPRVSYGLRLGAGAVLLVAVVGAIVLALVDRALARDLFLDLDRRLETQARGAAEWIGQGRHPERLAGRLADIVDARVTIFGGDGVVLGDSSGEGARAHEADAPEVRAALAGTVGRGLRVTAGDEVRYVAVPVGEGRVLRLGASVSTIRATITQVRLRLAAASAFGIAIAVALAYVAARIAAGPLVRMKDAASRIAEGDYAVALPGTSPDEFGELERSLSRLAARLEADRARIERLEATRRDFVANVSHELRTPVTAIRGYAETLLRGTADAAKVREFLETMHRQAERVGALVTDLLTLSELEARDEAPPAETVSIAGAARHAVATVTESCGDAPTIIVDVPRDLEVRGDASSIERILENLLENAVRYGAPPIRVSARVETGKARVVVADAGPGISAEHLPRLFERFYRTDPARSRAAGGTGLGLSIVKHLAESMGGTVEVESEIGKGTRFTVTLDPAETSLGGG